MFSFDSSDEDDILDYSELDPLNVDWMHFFWKDKKFAVAVGELPGRKYREIKRNLDKDLGVLQSAGITHVCCLCCHEDLLKFRVPNLLQEYLRLGFILHHHPIKDGLELDSNQLMSILNELKDIVECGEKIYIHCFSGLGISCVIAACLAMDCDESLSSTEAINSIRMLRGPRAVQTVKQYNFINDFKELQRDHLLCQPSRRLSR